MSDKQKPKPEPQPTPSKPDQPIHGQPIEKKEMTLPKRLG